MEDKFENIPEIYTTGKGLGSVTAKQERALKLYCNYHTTAQIAQNLETSFSTVRDWVYKGRCGLRPFREIRKELEKNMLQEIAGNRLPALKSIMDSSLCIVRDNLEKLKKSGTEFSIDEIKKVSEIAANLDKIIRLDEGQSTDNIAIAKVNPITTAVEAREILAEVDDFSIYGE